MITIDLTNGDMMKLDDSKYMVFIERGWLHVRRIDDGGILGKIRYIFPMTSVFSVSFD